MSARYCLLSLFFLVSVFSYCNNKGDSLLKKLDVSIKNKQLYIQEKENELTELKNMLVNTEASEEQYLISRKLMQSYSYYINDSAIFYSNKCMGLSIHLGKVDYLIQTKLDKAQLLSNSELFYESFKLLESIDINQISDKYKAKYFWTYIYIIKNQISDINDITYRNKYYADLNKNIDSYLACETVDSIDYKTVLSYKYYLEGNVDEVDRLITKILNNDQVTPNQHAEFVYRLGKVYLEAGQEYREQAKYYFILASIDYNRYAITRNPTILYLAKVLLDENEWNRAYEYTNLGLQDAGKFNNNQKFRDAEKAYTLIQNTYYARIEEQQKILKYYSVLLTITLIALCIAIYSFYKRNKILKKTKLALSESNLNLKENSHNLETFVGHYLDLYYSYILRLNDHRRYVLKELNSGKYENLILSETKAIREANSNNDKIFSDFDVTFLTLYPNFIQNVNKLLSDGNKYEIKYRKNESLPRMNTEIRILALIRLGISDNKKIASFLRISMQTMYNCRSIIKAKAINEITFEDDIKVINSV